MGKPLRKKRRDGQPVDLGQMLPPDIHQVVLARSWIDPEFRQEMLSNPHEALRKLGYQIADGVRVNVQVTPAAVLNLAVGQHPAGVAVTPGLGEGAAFRPSLTSGGGGCGMYCTLTTDCGCTRLTYDCPW